AREQRGGNEKEKTNQGKKRGLFVLVHGLSIQAADKMEYVKVLPSYRPLQNTSSSSTNDF
ncbi:MAG: hypothetical protein VB855_06340, partial [Pirellulaceae bacterium]